MPANEYRVSLWDDDNVLELARMMISQLCKYTNRHWIVHFRKVSFVVCELHIDKNNSLKMGEWIPNSECVI